MPVPLRFERRLFENHFPFAAETLRPALVAFAAMDDNDEWNDDLVIDAAQMREATPRVMERYAIPADRSSDLREDGGLVE